MEKSKQKIILPKCGFNFIFANLFNYLKPTMQLKTLQGDNNSFSPPFFM
jgi:hypothetical protein